MLAALLVLATIAENPAEKCGRMTHPAIVEASGIVASRTHPGIFWVHNDSGNPPLLFAVRKDGSLVREYTVGAPNVDWEDIAIDDSGHLYIGDIGNNLGALPIRAIYRIDEPDPSKPASRPLPVSLAVHYRYPTREAFDSEGLAIDGDRAILVTKRLDGKEAELFAVPLGPPAPLLRPSVAMRIGKLKEFTHAATGADLSADGKFLAVSAIDEVRIYRRDADGRWLHERRLKGLKGQIEGVCWDGRDLMLASEQRDLFRIAERTWRESKRAKAASQ